MLTSLAQVPSRPRKVAEPAFWGVANDRLEAWLYPSPWSSQRPYEKPLLPPQQQETLPAGQTGQVATVTREHDVDGRRRSQWPRRAVLVVAALAVLIGAAVFQRWRTSWAPFIHGNGVSVDERAPGATVLFGNAYALDEPVDILSADVVDFTDRSAAAATTVVICPQGIGALDGPPGPGCTPAAGHRLAPGQQLVAVVTVGAVTPALSPGVRVSFRRGWRSGSQVVGPVFTLNQP